MRDDGAALNLASDAQFGRALEKSPADPGVNASH